MIIPESTKTDICQWSSKESKKEKNERKKERKEGKKDRNSLTAVALYFSRYIHILLSLYCNLHNT